MMLNAIADEMGKEIEEPWVLVKIRGTKEPFMALDSGRLDHWPERTIPVDVRGTVMVLIVEFWISALRKTRAVSLVCGKKKCLRIARLTLVHPCPP
jgi:hypothetical protein